MKRYFGFKGLSVVIATALVIATASTVNYQTAQAAKGDTVNGSGQGTITCTAGNNKGQTFNATIKFQAEDQGNGEATGSGTVDHAGGQIQKVVTDGSVDGKKQYQVGSNNGINSTFCTGSGNGNFEISGQCGQNVGIKFVDDGSQGRFTGDVTCTSAS
jgi:Flp pilus assembly protein TadG